MMFFTCPPPPPPLPGAFLHSPGRCRAGRAAGLDRLALYEALQPVEVAVTVPGVGAQMAEIKLCNFLII